MKEIMKYPIFVVMSILFSIISLNCSNIVIDNKAKLAASTSEKKDALSYLAESYYQLGKYVQYDQKKMDADATTDNHTNRRQQNVGPYDPTRNNQVYLDCSSFVYNVYKQAFNYDLYNLLSTDKIFNNFTTRNLANINSSARVYRYNYDTDYTDTNIKNSIINKIKETLTPGDLFIIRRIKKDAKTESGHVMMYVELDGKGYLIHATGRDYNYETKEDNIESNGAIQKIEIGKFLTSTTDSHYIFSTKHEMKSLTIIRPLNIINNDLKSNVVSLAKQQINVEKYANIKESVGTSIGEKIKYSIVVKNNSSKTQQITIKDQVPTNTITSDKTNFDFSLASGASKTVSYTVEVTKDNVNIVNNNTTVNGVTINSITHVSKNKLSSKDQSNLKTIAGNYSNTTVIHGTKNYSDITSIPSSSNKMTLNNGRLISSIYYNTFKQKLNIENSSQLTNIIFIKGDEKYTLRKNTSGLSENEKKIYNMFVNNLYGGTKVETADLNDKLTRIRKLTTDDLVVGDIFFDRTGSSGSVYLYIGDGKLMTINSSGIVTSLASTRLDKALGNELFAVLRPSYILPKSESKTLSAEQTAALIESKNRFEKRIKAGSIKYSVANRQLNVYPENTSYLDSTSLIYNIYYNAFNVKLPINSSAYYTSNLNKVSDNYNNVTANIGDVIVYTYNGNGLAALVVDNNKVLRYKETEIFYQTLTEFLNECKSRNPSKFGQFRPVDTLTLNIRKSNYVDVTSIDCNSSLNILKGQTSKITANVKPTNATNKEVTYKSNNTSIATVDSSGNVKGIKAGSVDIVVTSKDIMSIKKTVKVVVSEPVNNKTISFSTSSYKVLKGHVLIIKPVINNAIDNEVIPVAYTSSPTSIIQTYSIANTKDKTKVEITGLKVGSTTLTAKLSNGKNSTATVSVIENTDNRDVSFQSNSYSLTVGKSRILTTTMKKGFNEIITFKSNNTSCVSISPNGKSVTIKGLKACTTTLTASVPNGKGHSVTVKVL